VAANPLDTPPASPRASFHPSRRSCWAIVFPIALLPFFTSLPSAHAQVESDVFGVRSNANPGSLVPNLPDFITGQIIQDKVLTEGASETDTIVFITSGIALPPNDVVNPNVTGVAYLGEPDQPTVVSDMVTLSAAQNGVNIQWTLTLTSDPANFPTGLIDIPESGQQQDVSGYIFIGLITPAVPGTAIQFPFHVVVTSDLDVPEPASCALLLPAHGLLALRGRWNCSRRR